MSQGFFRSPAPTADGRADLHEQVTGDNKDRAAAHLHLCKLITADCGVKFPHMCKRTEIPGGGLKDPTEGTLGEAAMASV